MSYSTRNHQFDPGLYSTRYYQLTPEILVEYNYNKCNNNSESVDLGLEGDEPKDTTGYVVNNNYCASKTFLINEDKERFVLPVNKSESKFIQCYNNTGWAPEFIDAYKPVSTSSGNEDYDDDVFMDVLRLHFTSRNYFGDYDGIIISVTTYDKRKNKVGLLSYYINKTDDSNINETPELINQKLYTTFIDLLIPNTSAILESDVEPLKTSHPGEDVLRKKLYTPYDIMDNSPIVINAYGVKSTYENNNHEYYNTEKLNSIYVPVVDKTNNVEIVVKPADDGDYFVIYPEVDNGSTSFSDFLYNLSDERPEIYIVFHELTLTEHYTPLSSTTPVDVITHHEQHIINVGKSDVVDDRHLVNEEDLEEKMYYRPVLRYSGKDMSFTIEIKTHIINTFDNTTIVKSGSCTYGNNEGENAKKYGKKMNKIYLGEVPAQVNVYNKKPDIDVDGVRITNASSNVKIENHQHSVIGFIECANVGVAIEQIPTEQIK